MPDKRFATTKYASSSDVYEPTEVAHEVNAEAEILKFYFNTGGAAGDIEDPQHADLALGGSVYLYLTNTEIPAGEGKSESTVTLDDVKNNPAWQMYAIMSFVQAYNPANGLYGNVEYVIDADISRLAGNFQLVAFYRNL